jgi:fatty-acyl-CoA synthase
VSWFGALGREISFFLKVRALTKRYDSVKPETATGVADVLEGWAKKRPKHKAIFFEDKVYTYEEYNAHANRYALWARSIGIKRGDAVALLMENRPEYLFAWAGLAKVGAIAALINTNQRERALAHSLTISQAGHVILGSELASNYESAAGLLEKPLKVWVTGGPVAGAENLDAHLALQDPTKYDISLRKGQIADDKCFYIYTSGTTGLPKAANISHLRALAMMNTFNVITGAGERDRMYVVLPLYHSAGGVCAVGAALIGGGGIVIRRKFSATQFWDDCVKYEATLFQYIGELCRYMLNAPPHPKERQHKLRLITGNGLRPEIWTPFQSRFKIPKIVEFYGATEGNVSLVNFDGKVGAVGRIPFYLKKASHVRLFQFDVEKEQPVRGPDGFCVECQPGEIGEAVGEIRAGETRVRFEGYSKGSDTEKKLLRDARKKGDIWFRTGDLMRQDAQGYFYFVDRIGDTFRWKGENVSTNEVAEAISVYPGVKEANVYGVAVPGTDGRAGMAALVTDRPLDLKAFQAHLERNLPAYARPVFLRMQKEIEATGTFKHTKVQLVKEGFDPAVVKDPMFFFDPIDKAYQALTPEIFAMIQEGKIKW